MFSKLIELEINKILSYGNSFNLKGLKNNHLKELWKFIQS